MKYLKIDKLLPPVYDIRNQECYQSSTGLGILKTEDNTPKWGWLKHISVSHRSRYPSWDELVEIKNHFFGDVDCMMVLPKKEDYVNVHKNCFHIWQCPENWGIQ